MCVDMRLCIPVYVGDICCLWYRLIDYKISVISSKIPGEKTIKIFFFQIATFCSLDTKLFIT